MLKIKLPETLKILHRTYKLQVLEGEAQFGNAHKGEIDLHNGIIRVVAHQDLPELADTFLHEAIHGIWYGMKLTDEDEEERIVSAFATGLITFMQDNPDFMKAIRTMIKN